MVDIDTIDKFWNWVDKRAIELGLNSLRKLETASGYANGGIGRRINEKKPPTLEMAMGLCRALRVTWIELWQHAGFIDYYDDEKINPNPDALKGLDADLYFALMDQSEEFKKLILDTTMLWLDYKLNNKEKNDNDVNNVNI